MFSVPVARDAVLTAEYCGRNLEKVRKQLLGMPTRFKILLSQTYVGLISHHICLLVLEVCMITWSQVPW